MDTLDRVKTGIRMAIESWDMSSIKHFKTSLQPRAEAGMNHEILSCFLVLLTNDATNTVYAKPTHQNTKK
jgi:hypothetical protein